MWRLYPKHFSRRLPGSLWTCITVCSWYFGRAQVRKATWGERQPHTHSSTQQVLRAVDPPSLRSNITFSRSLRLLVCVRRPGRCSLGSLGQDQSRWLQVVQVTLQDGQSTTAWPDTRCRYSQTCGDPAVQAHDSGQPATRLWSPDKALQDLHIHSYTMPGRLRALTVWHCEWSSFLASSEAR